MGNCCSSKSQAVEGAIQIPVAPVARELVARSPAEAVEEEVVEIALKWCRGEGRTWDGWGTSLCWWATVFGDRDDLADVVFTLKEVEIGCCKKPLPGLGLNIARYCIGGSSQTPLCNGSKQNTSPSAPLYKQTEGFWIQPGCDKPDGPCWDWTRDQNQVNMLRLAKERGVDFLEAFSNSPMWWMLKNGSPDGGVLQQNNLKDEHFEDFAKYLAITVEHFKKTKGIEFTSLSPFNEPTFVRTLCPFPQTQERTGFGRGLQAWILGYVSNELSCRSLTDVVLTASDETSPADALCTWNALATEDLPGATRVMHPGSNAQQLVQKLNSHGYQNPSNGDLTALHDAQASAKCKPMLWMSEYGDGDCSGATLAKEIFRHLCLMQPTGWCLWQVVDPEWGLMKSDMSCKEKIEEVYTKYYVYAHFTRHIRKGMTILDHCGPNTVAAYDADSKELVIVTANFSDTPRVFAYSLLGFTVSGPVTRWLTQFDGCAKYHESTVETHGLLVKALFPERSIMTFRVQNAVAC